MRKLGSILALPAVVALAACDAADRSGTDTVAEDFSARINGPESSYPAAAEPASADADPLPVAEPLEPAQEIPSPQLVVDAQGPDSQGPDSQGPDSQEAAPGTQTSQTLPCGADLMGPFIGRKGDEETRAEIIELAVNAREVRFVPAANVYIRPDVTSARLNLMLDNLGVIRDARCG